MTGYRMLAIIVLCVAATGAAHSRAQHVNDSTNDPMSSRRSTTRVSSDSSGAKHAS